LFILRGEDGEIMEIVGLGWLLGRLREFKLVKVGLFGHREN